MKAVDTTIIELRRLVSPVLPLTDPGNIWNEALLSIRIRARDGYLYADATDRFVAGVSRRPSPGTGSEFDALIRTQDLKTLLRVIQPTKGEDVEIRIHPKDVDGTVLVEAGESRHLGPTTFRFKSLGATTAVDLWELLDKSLRAADPTSPMPFAINPEKLAVFAAAVNPDVNEGRLPLIVRAPNNGRGAVLVACGDHFIGLAMSMVSQGETNDAVLTQWISLIAPLNPGTAAPKAGAA